MQCSFGEPLSRWLSAGAATDTGRVRSRNEDAIHAELPESPAVDSGGWLGVVADGVGGRPAGQVASALAVKTIVDVFYGSEFVHDDRERLVSAVRQANKVVLERSRTCVEESGMATAVTAAAVWPRRLLVAHVGDGRAYLLHAGNLRRLTRDHTLVDKLVQEGALAPELAQSHPQRHVITRAIGTDDEVQIDVSDVRLRRGDVVMLCTDGLHGVVTDTNIRAVLGSGSKDAAGALVAEANKAGGPDNVSVVVVALLPRGGASNQRLSGHGQRFLHQILLPLARLRSRVLTRC